MNGFRLVGDISHLGAILFLVSKILYGKSVAGLSAKTQILYGLVFVTRYYTVFSSSSYYFISYYNTAMKILFLSVTWITVLLICVLYKKSYDRKSDSFRAEILVLICIPISLLAAINYTFYEVSWTFSISLEALAIIPQLYMISTTGYLEPYLRYYIFTLGLYRLMYVFNWIYRFYNDGVFDKVSVVGGCVQVLLYADFFYLCLTKGQVRATDPHAVVIVDNSQSMKEKFKTLRVGLLAKLKGGHKYQPVPSTESSPPLMDQSQTV